MLAKDKNYHAILGVAPEASLEEIKRAFRKKAFETHPDLNACDYAPFLEVTEAWEALTQNAQRNKRKQAHSSYRAQSYSKNLQEHLKAINRFVVDDFCLTEQDIPSALGELVAMLNDIFENPYGDGARQAIDVLRERPALISRIRLVPILLRHGDCPSVLEMVSVWTLHRDNDPPAGTLAELFEALRDGPKDIGTSEQALAPLLKRFILALVQRKPGFLNELPVDTLKLCATDDAPTALAELSQTLLKMKKAFTQGGLVTRALKNIRKGFSLASQNLLNPLFFKAFHLKLFFAKARRPSCAGQATYTDQACASKATLPTRKRPQPEEKEERPLIPYNALRPS